MNDPLPIHEALPGLLDALQRWTGAVLIAPPLKIKGGTGSPLRVLALVPGGSQ